MQIQLPEIPPSKKNSKIIVCRGTRPLLLPSKSYAEWHKTALILVNNQKDNKIYPIKIINKINIVFMQKGKRKFDLTNKAESIMDLLVDCGVIEDDNYSVVPEINLKHLKAKEDCTIINIL